MAKGYWIVSIEGHDVALYGEYVKRVRPFLFAGGGLSSWCAAGPLKSRMEPADPGQDVSRPGNGSHPGPGLLPIAVAAGICRVAWMQTMSVGFA